MIAKQLDVQIDKQLQRNKAAQNELHGVMPVQDEEDGEHEARENNGSSSDNTSHADEENEDDGELPVGKDEATGVSGAARAGEPSRAGLAATTVVGTEAAAIAEVPAPS